jgi:hypothetical protein
MTAPTIGVVLIFMSLYCTNKTLVGRECKQDNIFFAIVVEIEKGFNLVH